MTMPLTPETLPRHELNGLEVAVVEAANADLVGISGHIVRETTNTVYVREHQQTRQVPKRGTTFRVTLPDDTVVDVGGSRLIAHPARRTETRGASVWQ